ncbi:MAG TPA: hypothetical protein VNO23_15865, partial [Candidatus Binatia bacterium]|nr:hypothetical protein [Candidatus Binatia bacterium]
PVTRRLALATVAALYVQIVLGALLTHEGWIAPHLAGAALVFVVAPMATARVRRSGDAVAAPVARALLALLALQGALGVAAYLARFSPIWIPGEQFTILAAPVAHRTVGALLLALAVVQALRVSGAPAGRPLRTPAPPAHAFLSGAAGAALDER